MTTCLWVEEAVGSNKYGLPAGCWRALSGINNQSTFQPSPSHNRLSTPLYDVCTEADSSICVIWFCVTGECSLFFVCLFWVILWGCMVVFLCFVSFLLLCFLFTIFWFGLFVLCMSNSLFNKNCYMCALAEHTIFFFFLFMCSVLKSLCSAVLKDKEVSLLYDPNETVLRLFRR